MSILATVALMAASAGCVKIVRAKTITGDTRWRRRARCVQAVEHSLLRPEGPRCDSPGQAQRRPGLRFKFESLALKGRAWDVIFGAPLQG